MLVAVPVSNTSPTVASTASSAAPPAAKTKEQSSHSSSWRTSTIVVFEAKSNYVGILFIDI